MARILLIDPEETTRLMLRSVLEDAGYEVAESASAEEALRFFRQSPVDLFYLDPLWEETGADFITQIWMEYGFVKFIVITGGGRTSHLPSFQMQTDSFRTLTKPFGSQEVLRLIRELLGESPKT